MPRIALLACIMFLLSTAFAESPELDGKTQLSLHGSLDFQGPNGDNTGHPAGLRLVHR
jgi:hypothetical protein